MGSNRSGIEDLFTLLERKGRDIHAELMERPQALDMTASMDKGYRQLRTGQARKLMLLAQITRGVPCIWRSRTKIVPKPSVKAPGSGPQKRPGSQQNWFG